MAPATKRGAFPRPTVSTGYSATVEVLHRTSKWGEVRRLACPLRRFPFAAPPNCGGKVVAPATKGGIAFPSPVRAVVWFSPPEGYTQLMTEMLSTHSAPSEAGGKVVPQAPKGAAAGGIYTGAAGAHHIPRAGRPVKLTPPQAARPVNPRTRRVRQPSGPEGPSISS